MFDDLRPRVRRGLEKCGGGADVSAFAQLSGLLRSVDGDYRDPATWTALRVALGLAARPLHYSRFPRACFRP